MILAADLIRRRKSGVGMASKDPREFLPLSATDFQLLLSLADRGLHGYAISKSVRQASDDRVRIGLGSLYRIIARLLNSGLVEECEPQKKRNTEVAPRRKYRLTTLGRSVLRAEVFRLNDAVELARSTRLFADREA
jgi:DNA-binding PadR family transcriptional regulator